VIERNKTLLQGGYSTVSYLNTLEQGLLPLYTGQVFMQDNAPIYTSHFARNTLAY